MSVDIEKHWQIASALVSSPSKKLQQTTVNQRIAKQDGDD